ncbi:MAG: chromosomal replication initiator protein DnaA [Zoogloeaceae bacterium]|jgi:chromosomal replication initiator protein|nr:chromosomal replication initiator protein DnaA [Zoogloeaceae bacterium]
MSADFWTSCLAHFEQELPSQQFKTWIRPLRVEAAEAGGLRLLAPNGFIQRWVRKNYLARIQEYAVEFFAMPTEIAIYARPAAASAAHTTPETAAPAPSPTPAVAKSAASRGSAASPAEQRYKNTRLDPVLTFETLVVGRGNDLARAAAFQVAHSPGSTYNPLFVYGGSGLGKTHLAHAIGNHIVRDNPDKIVRYLHAEDYYTDVVKAYQQKAFDALKRYYRGLDVLLLDDVQFFNNKNRSQEEFFFVFNALLDAKKQMVITCDTYPKDINGLDDRLVTRFDWGLTVQIEPPEPEMRVAILQKKAENSRFKLPDDVAYFIANHCKSNVRELEGALKKVLAYATFRDVAVTLEVTREALKDIIGMERHITVEGIQKGVADYYRIKVADFFSKRRTRAIARPRQVAMWLAKELTNLSYPAIGAAFGGRDHTTVIHAVKTVNELKEKDRGIAHDLHVLIQVLKG